MTDKIQLFGSAYTLSRLRLVYPYMFPSEAPEPLREGQPLRYVGQLDPHVFADDQARPDEVRPVLMSE